MLQKTIFFVSFAPVPLRYIYRSKNWEAALWECTEPDAFFEECLDLSEEELEELSVLPAGKRRSEWLAVRYLLQLLDDPGPRRFLKRLPSGKPLFIDERKAFSLTHSGSWVGVVLHHKNLAVGIDVQEVQHRILRLSAKFMSEEERSRWAGHPEEQKICTLYWAGKEALFKGSGLQGVNFTVDLKLHLPAFREAGEMLATVGRKGQVLSSWRLHYRIFDDMIMAIAIPERFDLQSEGVA